jgi:hypothetical protein
MATPQISPLFRGTWWWLWSPFHVGDFLWQEIKNSSENPQRLCSYGPYISYIIKKVTQRAYPNDTKHRPLQPKPSRTVRVPTQ